MKIPVWLQHKFLNKLLAVVLFLAVLGVIAAIVYNVAGKHGQEPFTEFYMLGATGKAEDYTVNAGAGEQVPVTLGIHNEEGAPAAYRIEVKINGMFCLQLTRKICYSS